MTEVTAENWMEHIPQAYRAGAGSLRECLQRRLRAELQKRAGAKAHLFADAGFTPAEVQAHADGRVVATDTTPSDQSTEAGRIRHMLMQLHPLARTVELVPSRQARTWELYSLAQGMGLVAQAQTMRGANPSLRQVKPHDRLSVPEQEST